MLRKGVVIFMIGIIAAMSVELEKIVERMQVEEVRAVSGLTFTLGMLEGHKTVATVCGEGKVNAALCAEAMILLYAPSLIVNTGVAGALSDTLRVPDIAIATAVCEHDYDISPLGYQKGEVLFPGGSATSFFADKTFADALMRGAKELGLHAEAGMIVSGDCFIADTAKKQALVRDFGGIACEMEGGAIGHVAFLNQTPFAVIRAVSDSAEDADGYDPVRAAVNSVALTCRALALYQR